jgi:hypothetical protein
MKIILSILLLIPICSFSQLFDKFHIGLINDSDGYTLIRAGQGIDSPVIDTLFADEFFQFVPTDTSKWSKVYKMWNVSGFVYGSRISPLTEFDRNTQKLLLDSIFDIEAKTYLTQKSGIRNHHEEKFTPILQLFLKYMKHDFDNELLEKFIDILIIESGSADEMPPTTLGYLYQYYPDQVLNEVKKRKDEYLFGQLEFGFGNAVYGQKDFESLDKRIKDLLESYKK